MRQIRVLFLNQTTEIGGAEKVLFLLAKELMSRGHCPVIGAPGYGPLSDLAVSHGITFEEIDIPRIKRQANPFILSTNLWECMKARMEILQIVAKHEVDLIHVNHLRALIPLLLDAMGRPVIWHVHDVFRDKLSNRLLLRVAGRKVKRAVCVSKFVASNLMSLGFPSEKCSVLHNAIEPAQGRDDRASVRRRLGIPENARLVGSIGQIVPWKGQDILIKAASRIVTVYPDTCFVIVGKAFPGERETFEKKLKRMVEEKGLSGKFYFVGFQKDVLSIMSALDVLVHTSIKPDPFPTVLLEGLVAGAAIVASNIGGVPEIIKDRKNGILVEPGNPDALAKGVIELLGDSMLLRSIREEARRSAAKFQDVKGWIDKWETYYEECIQG